MPRGMMTTYGAGGNRPKVSVKGTRVIDPPVLGEGVDLLNLIAAEHAAKVGLIRSMNATRTYMKKLQKVQQDAGIWCAPRGVSNPVSAIGGSTLSSNTVDELDKLFARYVAAIRKGVDTTLEGLAQPLS